MHFGSPVTRRDTLPSLDHALLWTMRAWVLGMCRKQDMAERIHHVFHSLGAPEGGPQLDRFMRALSHGARRSLEVHCVCNPQVSDDELSLLAVFQLQQAERHEEAFETLCGLTAEHAAIAGCDSANRIAIALAECGQRLRAPLPLGGPASWHCTIVDPGLHQLH